MFSAVCGQLTALNRTSSGNIMYGATKTTYMQCVYIVLVAAVHACTRKLNLMPCICNTEKAEV